MKNLNIIKNAYLVICAFVFLAVTSGVSIAQTVSHPVSEVSTTAKFYKYNYKTSDTTMKTIQYILVLSSTGDVKSCFNACDECYTAHKGYTPKATTLKCNNCGLSFKIDELGSQGAGGCWPGKLVHTIVGDQVVINISDLATGLYYFESQALSGVPGKSEESFLLTVKNNELVLAFNSGETKNCQITGVDGIVYKNLELSGVNATVAINDLPQGAYFFSFELNGKRFDNKFLINR